MTINISSATLTHAGYGERLVEILAQACGQISVEITEDALVGDVQATRQTIQRLQAIGAKVYIDDFGTGFSALSYLHQFPVDFIKIDRSFVVAQRDPKGAQVLTGMLRFCEALNLGVVVEGVETAEQLAFFEYRHRAVYPGLVFQQGAARRPATGLCPQTCGGSGLSVGGRVFAPGFSIASTRSSIPARRARLSWSQG